MTYNLHGGSVMASPTYSQIIDPKTYNRLMEQHVHIPESDRHIVELVTRLSWRGGRKVLEIGCGPARLLRKLDKIRSITLTGVDHDSNFVVAGEKIIARQNGRATIICVDIAEYQPDTQYNVIVSQGMHHHIPKKDIPSYLENVRRLLRPKGHYIVGDEFLAIYQGEEERQIVAVMWYSHVIAWALRKGQKQLAIEEAKTLLDDLAMGEENIKSSTQLDLVLATVEQIEALVERADLCGAHGQAQELLTNLASARPTHSSGDNRLDLSRGDFKVHGGIFREEVTRAGFRVMDTRWFGPIDVSGAMGVFVLQKED